MFGIRGTIFEAKTYQFSWVCLGIAPETPPRCPKTPPRRPKTRPRRAKDAPRTRQGAPKTYQDATRRHKATRERAQDTPRRPKKQEKKSPKSAHKRNPLQTLISNRFGVDLGAFFVGFWRFLGSMFDDFELHFLKIFTPQEKHQQTRRAQRAKRAKRMGSNMCFIIVRVSYRCL